MDILLKCVCSFDAKCHSAIKMALAKAFALLCDVLDVVCVYPWVFSNCVSICKRTALVKKNCKFCPAVFEKAAVIENVTTVKGPI